ncbi:MAG: OmpA family protein, partial [Myxococcales bacterium]|nr:OmpA family protein [Myxococcales bacterium]
APERNTWELGVYGGLFLPSPNHEFYEVGPDNPMPVHLSYATVAPDFGARVGYYPLRILGVELGGGVMPTRTVGGNAAGLMIDEAPATLYTFRAWGLLQAPYRVAPFVRAGFGLIGTSSTALGRDIDPAFHFGGGVKFYVNRWFGLRLDVIDNVATRVGISEGRAHNVEVLLGLIFRLGGKGKQRDCVDTDGDSMCDEGQEGVPAADVDRCTYEFGPRENYGCPYRDSDLDGLYDPEQPGLPQEQIDGCWQVPGPSSNRGCPVDPDRDRLFSQNPPDIPPLPPDIIVDNCELIPGPLSNVGCPENPDGDKNYSQNPAGVPPLPPEYIPDSCPVVPGPPEYRGCPADPDKDTCPTPNPSDIPPLPPEYTPDMCPDEPGPVSNNGCPETVNTRLAIKNITFANDRWDLLDAGKSELDQVADVLAQFPDVRLEISGHTSAPGSAKHNKKLSERRAKAVKNYLVGKGVAPSRLEVSWHGEEMLLQGVDPKDERNRRIEFHLLSGNPEAIKILNNG